MLFNTVKLLSPTGDGGGQDQTPTGQENDNKQPTLEEVVKGFSTVNETVSKITQTLENVMKAVEELKAPKKADNPQPQATDNKALPENVVTKDYLENFQKTLIESVTKASQTVLTQDKETRMIDEFMSTIPEKNKAIATALKNANAGKPAADIIKAITDLGLAVPDTGGYSTSVPKGMSPNQYLAQTELSKSLGLTEDDFNGKWIEDLINTVKKVKYQGRSVLEKFLRGKK